MCEACQVEKSPPQISPGGESVDGDLPPAAPVAETAPTHRYVSLHRQPVPRRYRLLLLALFWKYFHLSQNLPFHVANPCFYALNVKGKYFGKFLCNKIGEKWSELLWILVFLSFIGHVCYPLKKKNVPFISESPMKVLQWTLKTSIKEVKVQLCWR